MTRDERPEDPTLGPVECRAPQALAPYRFRYILLPDLFPDDHAQLESAIGAYAVAEPLVILSDGRVVDGQHRHAIALKLGLAEVPVRVGVFADAFAIEWYALQCLILHRQLTPAQKFQLAEPLARAEAELARRRQRAALEQFQGRLDAHPPEAPFKGKTLQRIARKIGISVRSAEQIKTVMDKGPPGLFDRLLQSKLTINRAYRETMGALRGGERRPAAASTPAAPPAPPAPRESPRRAKPAPAAPPERPRMPASTRLALQELYSGIMGWIKESASWPAKDRALLLRSLGVLAHHMEELIFVLSQYVKDLGAHPPPAAS